MSPLKIGPINVRNRMVISAHHSQLGDGPPVPGEAGFLGERYAHYVGERAKGGVGLIVAGQLGVHPTTRFELPNICIAYDERAIPGLTLIADTCHRHGAKVLVQLFHSGFIGTSWVDGTPIWSASENCAPARPNTELAKPMEREDIEDLKHYYALSSRNLMRAGMDGAEIHAAHGYLLQQFLSPLLNRRTDEYGGSLENRMRLMIEVIETVRNEIGRDKVLGMRISADEFLPGGLQLEDLRDVARRLDEHGGLDYLSVSQGTATHAIHVVIPPMDFPHGAFAYLAAGIREVVKNMKIFTVGRIVDPLEAERILADGCADMVIMTRAHIADPEIGKKVAEGRLEEIRVCCGDMQGCLSKQPGGLRCTQNPVVSREKEWAVMQLASSKKRVMVVGGGPGGMEAAWVAAARGHQVTLYEKTGVLGGQILLARELPTRAELDGLIRWRKLMLERYAVKVLLNTEVTAAMVARERPDVVIIATGSIPRRDGYNPFTYNCVPGWESQNVVIPEDILAGRASGPNVLVCDVEGHARGVGIAEKLIGEGKSVHLVYPAPQPGWMLPAITQSSTIKRIGPSAIDLYSNLLVVRIEGSSVGAFDTVTRRSRSFDNIDTVVMVGNATANAALYTEIKGSLPELYRIGDAKAPWTMERAIWDGHRVSRMI